MSKNMYANEYTQVNSNLQKEVVALRKQLKNLASSFASMQKPETKKRTSTKKPKVKQLSLLEVSKKIVANWNAKIESATSVDDFIIVKVSNGKHYKVFRNKKGFARIKSL